MKAIEKNLKSEIKKNPELENESGRFNKQTGGSASSKGTLQNQGIEKLPSVEKEDKTQIPYLDVESFIMG